MCSRFFSTVDSFGPTIARLALGLVMLPHGLQKTLGVFHGPGFSGTMSSMTSHGMPTVVAILVICGESLGSLGLIFGFITRFCAFGSFLIMSGAILMVHHSNGFFMNWSGQKPGEGYEYHVLAIGLALAIMVMGAGKLSIDRVIARACKK